MGSIRHYTGELIPTGQTIKEYMKDIDIPYPDDFKEKYFHTDLYDEAILIDGQVYKVERQSCEEDEGDEECIFEIKKNTDKTFSFEVKYPSGGSDFGEALMFSLERIE